MQFKMRGGVLSSEANQQVQAILKGALWGPKKRVLTTDKNLALWTDIRGTASSPQWPGDVRAREYVLLTPNGTEYATAQPDYADDDKLTAVGPAFRTPHVDHAKVRWGDQEFRLAVQNGRNYTLSDSPRGTVAEFLRKGPFGGWDIKAEDSFPAEFLCAIFAFGQYLEQENELLIV